MSHPFLNCQPAFLLPTTHLWIAIVVHIAHVFFGLFVFHIDVHFGNGGDGMNHNNVEMDGDHATLLATVAGEEPCLHAGYKADAEMKGERV